MTAQMEMAEIRVAIIAPADGLDQPWIDNLRTTPGVEVVARVGALAPGIEAVEQLQPDVLIVDRPVDEIESTLHAVYPAAPRTLCVAVLPEQDLAALRRVIGAGGRDEMIKPLATAELVASLRQVVQMEAARREMAGVPGGPAERKATELGKVIVVMGAKGGVGATTVAANLAVALRQVSDDSVVLADFSLQFGDVAVLLNVWSKHSVHNLALHAQTLDDTLLERVLVTHNSGVRVLQAPADPEQAGDISSAQLAAIVGYLRTRFCYVVIDCWSFVDEITETLVGGVDRVVVVTTPEVPALKSTKLALDYFTRRGLPRERISLVLNRRRFFSSMKGIGIGPDDVEAHLGQKIQVEIPNDDLTMLYAANKGIPVVQGEGKSWIAQSIRKLAETISGKDVVTSAAQKEARASQAGGAQPRARRWFGWG